MKPLETVFPGLVNSGYQVTSPHDPDYNCVAWAAQDTRNWWWPIPDADEFYWPPGVPREETVDAFRAAFATLGYVPCADDQPEVGFEKIALYGSPDGCPQHAARQLPNGRWTSKIGIREDIEHALPDLVGDAYGSVVLLMKRPVP